MKKTVIVFFLTLGLIDVNNVSAQMGTAKTITWDIKIDVDTKAVKGDVWASLNNDEKLKQYSNGYVKSVKTIDHGLVETREIVFTNGSKRTETITQSNAVEKFMVLKINKASLPKGVKSVQIAIFTKYIDGENTNILWIAKIEGKKQQKQKLITQLTKEFNAYAKGFGS